MTSSWETTNGLQNASQLIRNSGQYLPAVPVPGRMAPVVPPRPFNSNVNSPYSTSYTPYSYSGVGGYGNYSSYGSYNMPYRNSLYNCYGPSYGSGLYGGGTYQNFPADDTERRFIQYAEENSRHTFASVESVVRAFNSLAMMLDNTFFAMTSSFRAVLSVAENFGRLRSMFGHIWYSVNIFRFFSWLFRKIRQMMGYRVPSSATSVAWREATFGSIPSSSDAAPGTSWPTIAFLGLLMSAPYIISKFLPKYVDKSDPTNWKSPGVRAKACFDFIATNPSELTIQTNDTILLAPPHIQEEMNLKNTGWAFAVFNGKSGVVPLNYVVINKAKLVDEKIPVPRIFSPKNGSPSSTPKANTKRVSFGENQIFENVDLENYIAKSESSSSQVSEERKKSSDTKNLT